MLKYVKDDEVFILESNGTPTTQLEYLSPQFRLVDEDPEFFDAEFAINDDYVVKDSFEWQTGTFSHKITEAIDDAEVEKIDMERVQHSAEVTSEAISVLSTLRKPEKGFQSLSFSFLRLSEKVSETVLD